MSGVSLCHFFTLPLRIHHFKWSGATIPLPDVPKPQTGIIVGTGTDVNDDTVPGATVVLEGPVQTDPENKSLQCQFVEAHKGLPLWDLPACRSARLLRG